MFGQASSPPARHPGAAGLVLPFLLIAVGAVLLLNNLGVVPFSIWSTLAQLWPVILVLVGIELLLGRRRPGLGALIAGVGLLLIIGLALWWTPVENAPTALRLGNAQDVPVAPAAPGAPVLGRTDQSAVIPLGDAKQGKVAVSMGAGNLIVDALPSNSPHLAQASASLPSGIRLSQQQSVRDNSAEASFNVSGGGFTWPFAGNDQRHAEVEISLSRQVPLSLEARIGAGQSEIDLTDLTVADLSLSAGAGQTTVRFPATGGSMTVDIQNGAGQLILVIPPEVGAYLHTSTGLVNLNLPNGRFTKVSDGYQTSNYSSASSQLNLSLHMGVGEVDVR